jgi:hypothetical protein
VKIIYVVFENIQAKNCSKKNKIFLVIPNEIQPVLTKHQFENILPVSGGIQWVLLRLITFCMRDNA